MTEDRYGHKDSARLQPTCYATLMAIAHRTMTMRENPPGFRPDISPQDYFQALSDGHVHRSYAEQLISDGDVQVVHGMLRITQRGRARLARAQS